MKSKRSSVSSLNNVHESTVFFVMVKPQFALELLRALKMMVNQLFIVVISTLIVFDVQLYPLHLFFTSLIVKDVNNTDTLNMYIHPSKLLKCRDFQPYNHTCTEAIKCGNCADPHTINGSPERSVRVSYLKHNGNVHNTIRPSALNLLQPHFFLLQTVCILMC